jgi:RimJ/RimL family protein N-acetyltransferase
MKEKELINPQYKIIFETENIIFIQISDLLINEYLKMYNDEEIQRDIFKKSYSPEKILNWIKNKLQNINSHTFSLIEKGTNEYIGDMEIIPTGNNIGEIIISITPKKQNNHYGTEAIKYGIKYAFETLKLEEVELYVYKNNSRAIHCYEKIGFIKDGPGKTDEDIHMKISK